MCRGASPVGQVSQGWPRPTLGKSRGVYHQQFSSWVFFSPRALNLLAVHFHQAHHGSVLLAMAALVPVSSRRRLFLCLDIARVLQHLKIPLQRDRGQVTPERCSVPCPDSHSKSEPGSSRWTPWHLLEPPRVAAIITGLSAFYQM